MRSSIKRRILLWFGGITTLILVLFTVAFYIFLQKSIRLKIETRLATEAKSVQDALFAGTPLQQYAKSHLQDAEAAVVRDGKIIDRTKNFKLDDLSGYLHAPKHFFMLEREQSVNGIYLLQMKLPFAGAVVVVSHDINNMAEDVEDTLLFLEPLLLLLLLFAASRVIDKILKPVQKITRTARRISIDNFAGTIPLPEEEDEIRALVESFNAMIERLREGAENLERFNSDVSHELKTPLTVIRGETEVTLRKPRDPQIYIRSLQTVAYEADQMEQIVENLLLLNRYTRENIAQTFEACHLDAIVLRAVERHETRLREKRQALKIDRLENITLAANPLLMAALFANLIDNAVKYTPEDKKITLSLYRDTKIHFVIVDEGVGIPAEKLPKVTDRFYRVDTARSRRNRGFGLGLSIAQKSVHLHGGEMRIASAEGKGTTVHVVL